jgi:hypothetical protein
MTPLRVLLVVTAAALVAVPTSGAAKPRLRAFHSCAALGSYVTAHARTAVPPSGGGTVEPMPAAPQSTGEGSPKQDGTTQPAPTDTSGTNVQEPGIDEPDVVKSDGQTLFTVAGGSLRAVAEQGEPRLLGSLPIEGGDTQLLEHDGRLLVISRGAVAVDPGPPVPGRPVPEGPGPVASSIAVPLPGQTVLTEVDARDPAAMRVVRTMRIDGAFVDARQKDAVARVVVSAAPTVAPGEPVRPPVATLAWGTRKHGKTRRLVQCDAVRHPAAYDGSSLLTVLTIDLDRGLPPIDSDAVMTDARIVYGSATSLYTATGTPSGDTEIHKFDTSDPTRTDYRASGAVTGELLNNYALSEQDGRLRAATTDNNGSESLITVLAEDGGKLVPVGKLTGLGRGERIYAVRFIGNTAYVVTFRQIDPLFTVDLSDPTAPRLVGELQLQGYSAYLHPVGDNLLLGVGQDANAQGRQLGTQLSLFDVSDLANPVRVAQASLGSSSSSEAEFDPHAFLWWGPSSLAVVPLRQQTFTGAVGFKVGRGGITEVGRITHLEGQNQVDILRSAVVGDRLFTVSTSGVKVSGLDGLADQAFVAFPTPAPVPSPQPAKPVR